MKRNTALKETEMPTVNEGPDPSGPKTRLAGGSRSPNYPQMNIIQAIERIKKVYAVEHTHSVPDQSIASALGYSSLNGTSKVVLSAMKKFGLLVASGDGFKVSQDAIAIIELPPDDSTRIVALHKSALRPPVFKQLYEKYGNDLPSDASLRHYLVSIGFESDAANQVIRFFKETLNFLSSQAPVKEEQPELEREVEVTKRTPEVSHTTSPAITPVREVQGTQRNIAGGFSQLRFPVSPDCFAEVTFTSQITQEAINKLISYLEISLDLYPAQALSHQTRADRRSRASSEYAEDGLDDEEYAEEE